VKEAKGDYLLVQDADLEYAPNDYPPDAAGVACGGEAVCLWEPSDGQIRDTAEDFSRAKHPEQGWALDRHLVISLWTFLLYGKWIRRSFNRLQTLPHAFSSAK